MQKSGEEPEGTADESLTEINEPISRSDFLKKIVAGGVVSAVAISGFGGLQKVFADNSQTSSLSSDISIEDLIQKVNQLQQALNNLQGQFSSFLSGKLQASEISTLKISASDASFLKLDGIDGTFDKVQVPETGYLKINGDATFLKIDVPENGFLKMSGESTFLKLTVPENGFMKINGDSSFLKLDVPENGFLKMEGDSSFLKLTVPENGFMKIDSNDVSFLKLDATEIVADKIVAGSIITKTPTTTTD